MTASVLHRRAPALTPRALVSAVSLCFVAATPALAQGVPPTLGQVVVTGSRFNSDPALTPIGATVITADEIRRAGAGDVNQAIRKLGGVYGRQSLDGSPDFGLDLRGFGTNSNQNMVIVLDGVRMSENELAAATLSTIPVDSVERIEITRGGSSVLYGDGATGGVINIVTKRPVKGGHGTVYAEVGQLGQREVRGSAAQTWDGFTLDGALGTQRTDNYRDNNAFEQKQFHLGAQWALQNGRAGVRLDSTRQDFRLPGPLSPAQFQANPRQARTPDNFASQDSDRVTAFVERRFGAVDLAAELSRREKTAESHYVDSDYAATYTSKQTQFSPRLRYLAQSGGLLNELVTGVDLIRWSRLAASDYSQEDTNQTSRAIYVRDEIKFDGPRNARIAAGARHEIFDKDSYERLYAFSNYDFKQSLNAWDLQGSFNALPLLNLHAKAGQSYRIVNSDENGYTATGLPLKPQKSHDLEFGATIGHNANSLTARLFSHRLTNEIYFDSTPPLKDGKNTNLAPTKREGVEIEGHAQLAANWHLSGHLQHVKATFREGSNTGKEMALVPKNIVSARLSWTPADGQSADLGVQWVDKQSYGSDFNNTCANHIPSYTTVDARYARKLGAWEFALSGLNLTDKQYYSNAFGSRNEAFVCSRSIYPSDGRQLKVSARYDF